jgi:hypothetical protein
MYVRCADCLASTWIDVVLPDGRVVETAECGECGRRHAVAPIEELGGTVGDHYRRVLSFSSRQDLDMSSAYSVLLGIMSLEQAEVLRHSLLPDPKPGPPDDDLEAELESEEPSETPGTEAAPAKPVHPDSLPTVPDFDLGFMKAISKGHLTVQQAMTRGNRDAFARRLMRRRGLPEELAYRVTDNRLSLREAMRLMEEHEAESPKSVGPPPAAPKPRRATASRAQKLVVFGLATVAVTAVMWTTWSERSVPERRPARKAHVASARSTTSDSEPSAALAAEVENEAAAPRIEIRRDDAGRVLEVNGPDPSSVLVAYCEAAPTELGLAPIEITNTVPRFRHARLGTFRDFAALDSDYAIRIHRDSRTGRWVAGGHASVPIQVMKAPKLPADAMRIPVKRP